MPSGTAPGHRGSGEGALWGVGIGGYNWSSTSYDSGDRYRGVLLHYYATYLNPSDVYLRAYGFQLRCLSE
ncbi:hypothetical protein [uncultured Rikenella sp.]|uniref:hypothetical protein n=1 Tax=uncultured Rikenella sp. TaxID=368003 RepID=UPI002605781B|nr:hypothetical protein [uncultured Rikenella sp.]